jgi:hypothetical protein
MIAVYFRVLFAGRSRVAKLEPDREGPLVRVTLSAQTRPHISLPVGRVGRGAYVRRGTL